tara:strand:+ start:243 stop:443 length:201 start_codon:yes stop_codon:yes gene_type:complete
VSLKTFLVCSPSFGGGGNNFVNYSHEMFREEQYKKYIRGIKNFHIHGTFIDKLYELYIFNIKQLFI